MKTLIPIFVFLLAMFAACKKKDSALPTTMRVKIDNDTVFITTKVTSSNSAPGYLYIMGESEDGKQKLEFTLANYAGKPGTFEIDQRGIGGSTCRYVNGSTSTVMQGGAIVVNSVADGVIKGVFNVYRLQIDVIGSFTAPQK